MWIAGFFGLIIIPGSFCVADEYQITAASVRSFTRLLSKSPYLTCNRGLVPPTLGELVGGRVPKSGVRWGRLSKATLQKRLKLLQKRRTKRFADVKALQVALLQYDALQKKCKKMTAVPLPTPTPTAIPTGTPGPAQFLGSATSLSPYREQLTDDEIQHILRKVAFGGNDELRKIGKEQGLSALVSALVDGVMRPEERAAFEQQAEFWASQGYYYDKDDPEYKNIRIWTSGAAQAQQIFRMIYSREPLREYMTQVLATHFAVNLSRLDFSYSKYGNYGIPLHVKLLRESALGNFRDGVVGLLLDPAMNYWLDNKENRVGEPNQNFARELLELFTLGTNDPVSRVANYDERTVKAATAFVSGYFEKAQVDPIGGKDVVGISYNPDLHDPAAYTIFPGIGGAEFAGNLQASSLVRHILEKHPGAARYLGDRIAGQMLYPGLSEGMVAQLSQILVQKDFNLAEFIRPILKSEAMFSEQSRDSCVASPIEHFLTLSRSIFPKDLPSGTGITEKSYTSLVVVAGAAAGSGQSLFEPPSVFGWKGACNINRASGVSVGEGWISAQRLLGRDRGCGSIMDVLNWMEVDWAKQFGLTADMDAGSILDSVNRQTIRIPLNQEERAILLPYLNSLVQDDGTRVSVGVTFEDWWMKKKVPRLICLLSGIAGGDRR
jgi:uncharacterized protein (DUF1800 family)